MTHVVGCRDADGAKQLGWHVHGSQAAVVSSSSSSSRRQRQHQLFVVVAAIQLDAPPYADPRSQVEGRKGAHADVCTEMCWNVRLLGCGSVREHYMDRCVATCFGFTLFLFYITPLFSVTVCSLAVQQQAGVLFWVQHHAEVLRG
jgi:hypothetical protein